MINLIEQFYTYYYKDKSLTEIEKFRKENNLQPYRIKQIFFEIFKNFRIDFEDMTTLPKELRKLLLERFEILSLKPVKILDSYDTTKIAFETKDKKIVESVIMYHREGINGRYNLKKSFLNSYKRYYVNRITLCVSSQIGCPVGCVFCVTGKIGFVRNLTFDEIISQLIFANFYVKKKFGKKEDGTWRCVRNVVFMGMGEPLLNYENVKKSILIMLDQRAFSLSKRRVTISTSGIVPGIKEIIDDKLPVMLAVSLHAPNQYLREKLIPIARIYYLDQLMGVLDKYVKKTGNRLFYEYIMIKEVTDTPELAFQLANLIKGQKSHINLIPYNENPTINFEESNWERITKFKGILESKGITVTVRDSLGRDIKGACGQLGYEFIQND